MTQITETASDLIFDPRDPEFINNPAPFLQRLQALEPVYWSKEWNVWLITRHSDAKEILKNDNISSDRLTPFFEAQSPERKKSIQGLIRYINTWVSFKDPPEHARLRQLMASIFTLRTMLAMEGYIQSAVDHLIASLEGQDEFDFIEDFAFKLPAMVIMELLGLPQEDMEQVKVWSNKIQLFLGSATTSPEKYALAEEGANQMAEYFRQIIRQRELNPGSDLISKLLATRLSDDSLTEDEVIGTSMLFLFGGHETTTNLIGNGIKALLQNPDQLALLREKPELIQKAVEEMLRFDGPTGAVVRIVKETHEFHGKELRKGDRVFVMINGANRDPDVFENPNRFDITRSPNPQLTFIYGQHFCMGAPLARLEGKIAIGSIIEKMPDLKLAADHYDYMDTMVMRGMRNMLVCRGS